MVHAVKGTGGMVAAAAAVAVLSAGVVVFSATVVGERLVAMQTASAAPFEMSRQESGAVAPTVNRTGKTDKLPVSDAQQTRAEIKSVEVVGVRGAAIVYRDRNGNVLFETDPLANVTVVTKNVELPEVTIREAGDVKVERMPVEEARPSEQPQGCESAFARPSPEELTRMSSRCVTQLMPGVKFATLR